MPQALIALFTNLAGIIGGALNGVLGTAVSMMKAGTKLLSNSTKKVYH